MTSPESLTITTLGRPAAQGSKRLLGRVMVEASAAVAPWRAAVTQAAVDAIAEAGHEVRPVYNGPVFVDMCFTVRKPTSAPKTRVSWPSTRPDLDKLVRACGDAIVAAGVLRDDAQIVELAAAKRYPLEGPGSLPVPGVVITVQPADHQPTLGTDNDPVVSLDAARWTP
ncbi:RusA family crossover junction endodeoxyribonuclease [Streptomyces sp. AV19]|uniref:RusA family crossover junction endodeoxyribonuclease n=1 Tax=Streptomyces sp. AV19 TaxID=2793068 RepID=UPI0018FF024B|nr:RusA family crossover junction endodeoxyribonuclease [Streptomyces sp. AV19]MBH1932789.1 RusA family crossover junction endodeoxyribonuclease [Streptomyces sp. AV19]MDG4531460.1 RusA family crossover junction endodeoxyribonuclease [Streptomyces sp. AV19]